MSRWYYSSCSYMLRTTCSPNHNSQTFWLSFRFQSMVFFSLYLSRCFFNSYHQRFQNQFNYTLFQNAPTERTVHYKLFQLLNEKIKKFVRKKYIGIQLQIGVPFKSFFLSLSPSSSIAVIHSQIDYYEINWKLPSSFFLYGFYNDTHQTESNPNQSTKCQERQKKREFTTCFCRSLTL